jgi:Fur family iron response transcriptional regulator
MDLTTTSWADIPSEPFVEDEAEVASEHHRFREECIDKLRQVGLRPTRQRLMLGTFLFSKGGRHVTAEMLHAEAVEARMHISLATVYNTLNQFRDAGLLRQIGVDGTKSFFDTNPTTHPHFFVDREDRLLDVPDPGIEIDRLPEPLPGYEISQVEVIVHLRRKRG